MSVVGLDPPPGMMQHVREGSRPPPGDDAASSDAPPPVGATCACSLATSPPRQKVNVRTFSLPLDLCAHFSTSPPCQTLLCAHILASPPRQRHVRCVILACLSIFQKCVRTYFCEPIVAIPTFGCYPPDRARHSSAAASSSSSSESSTASRCADNTPGPAQCASAAKLASSPCNPCLLANRP